MTDADRPRSGKRSKTSKRAKPVRESEPVGDGANPPLRRVARGLAAGAALLVALAVVGVILFVAVFPTSDYLAQRRDLASARAELELARSDVAELENRLGDYNDRLSVSRIARERFSLVYEGEKLYRLSIHAGDAAELPDEWLWPGFARLVRGG